MADDFTWTLTGTTPWSGTYRGKRAVLDELIGPLFAQFADQYTNTADRFIAADDYVVVDNHGALTTKAGKPYNNRSASSADWRTASCERSPSTSIRS